MLNTNNNFEISNRNFLIVCLLDYKNFLDCDLSIINF